MTDQLINPIRVYIAGPLFGSGRASANIQRVIKVAERLRAAGMFPFIPHLFFLWDTVSPHDDGDYWLAMDRVWLECCDAMVRLHGDSPGSVLEEQWCEESGIPVYHHGDGQYGVNELICDCIAGKIRSLRAAYPVAPASDGEALDRMLKSAQQRAAGKVCNTCDRALDADTKRYWRCERPDLDTEYMKEVADWFFSCPEPACFPTGPGWEDRTPIVRVAGKFRGLLAGLLPVERKEETSDD